MASCCSDITFSISGWSSELLAPHVVHLPQQASWKDLFYTSEPLRRQLDMTTAFFTIFLQNIILSPEWEGLKHCFGRVGIVQRTLWDWCFYLYSGPPGRELKRCFSGFLSGELKRLYKYPSCSSPRSPGTRGYDASMFLQECLVVPAPPVSLWLSFPATVPLGGSCHIVSPSSRCSPSAVIFLLLRQYY